ncbi:c-type cytochrome [Flavobacterium urocaniciphilum]|uniref:Cytochrome c domain-containing protein n=1 Tax=Flavobacterium urocaniciphilum TaxID=1299341 RepID=A0A1H8YVE0_9FLAO|nr:cytochrome c [Flavobacterium urocaniciphilum]SEP56031.1 hypothetical protein SAMN05444005_101264 [Flavobacterium urocaniciphilum]
MRKLAFIIIPILTITSCTNHSEEDLTDPLVLGNTKFATDVKPIIDNNCISCHANVPQFGAPMPLTSLEAVKEAIINRNLIGKISRPDGAPGLMPFGGPRLPQNSIDKIVDWKNSGYLE